jgi:hypothetical protein
VLHKSERWECTCLKYSKQLGNVSECLKIATCDSESGQSVLSALVRKEKPQQT